MFKHIAVIAVLIGLFAFPSQTFANEDPDFDLDIQPVGCFVTFDLYQLQIDEYDYLQTVQIGDDVWTVTFEDPHNFGMSYFTLDANNYLFETYDNYSGNHLNTSLHLEYIDSYNWVGTISEAIVTNPGEFEVNASYGSYLTDTLYFYDATGMGFWAIPSGTIGTECDTDGGIAGWSWSTN